MSSTLVRTRLLTFGGGLLTAAGLAAVLVLSGPTAFAETAGVEANAEVSSTITITADEPAFTLTGLPGETATAFSDLTVETNNTAGYNVTVEADADELTPADTEANTDTIPIADLEVENDADTFTSVSDTTPVTVHTQEARSEDEGDTVTASYRMEMPFVNADIYSVDLTFTAATN